MGSHRAECQSKEDRASAAERRKNAAHGASHGDVASVAASSEGAKETALQLSNSFICNMLQASSAFSIFCSRNFDSQRPNCREINILRFRAKNEKRAHIAISGFVINNLPAKYSKQGTFIYVD